MSTVLDQNFQLGLESNYGTAVTPTRAYEVKADAWKLNLEDLPSVGMRPGMQGEFSDRQKTIIMGGTGAAQFDVLTKGFGLVLQAMFGTTAGPTLDSGTAYTSTHATATADPLKSYTTQMQRVDDGGTLRPFTFPGSVITGWKLSHTVPGLLVADLTFDARTGVTSEATASAVSPTAAASFDWTQCAVTIGGAEFCVETAELEADLSLKTDRRLMCSADAGLKRQPKRNGVPAFTGTLAGEFEDLTEYNLFVNGTISAVVMTWTGANITGAFDYQLELTLPACKFSGDANPVSSLDDVTKQPLPFRALYNGSSALCTATYTSTDAAL